MQTEWLKSSEICDEIELDAYQIMPNHFHGIVIIRNGTMDRGGERPFAPTTTFKMRTKSLSSLMAGFQSPVTSKINQLRCTPKQDVWQRNYFDRIIRNDNELNRIRKYIIENPMKWDMDKKNQIIEQKINNRSAVIQLIIWISLLKPVIFQINLFGFIHQINYNV